MGQQHLFRKLVFLFLLFFLAVGTILLAPTRVEAANLLSFTATYSPGQIVINWETTDELDLSAFYIQRSVLETTGFVRISGAIPAEGDGATGRAYGFTDTDIAEGTTYYYRLEVVKTDATIEYYGPIAIVLDIWRATGPDGLSVNALVIDPGAPTTIYASTGSGMFKSIDGGANWQAANLGLPSPYTRALAVDPETPNTLYVGMQEEGIFKSTNGGESWVESNEGLTCPYIYSIAIHPTTPNTLYVGTLCGVYRSINGGETWSVAKTGLSVDFVFALAIDPVTPTILYAGTESAPPPPLVSLLSKSVTAESLFKSTNGGDSWNAANVGLPASSRVHALAIDPITPTTLYTSISVGGMGVYKSTDGGGSWFAASSGLQTYGNIVMTLAIDPITPTTLYAGGDHYGVYKSVDGGDNWTPINAGLTATCVQALAIDPETPEVLYAGAAWDGVFKSMDKGSSWHAVNHGFPPIHISALAIDPLNSNNLYAGTYGDVYKSVNGAGSWNGLNAILNSDWVYTLVHLGINSYAERALPW